MRGCLFPLFFCSSQILRDLARRLGLETCSTLVKRAMQFGTRIGKETGGKGTEAFA